jgi:hypothetical protein
MSATEPDGVGPNQAGTPAEQHSGDPTAAPQAGPPLVGGVEATDRPGDIPFDQAAAEHENPALE